MGHRTRVKNETVLGKLAGKLGRVMAQEGVGSSVGHRPVRGELFFQEFFVVDSTE